MNIYEIVAGIEVELQSAKLREKAARDEAEKILDNASSEGRTNLTAEEDQRCETLISDVELAKAQQLKIGEKLARARKIQAEEDEITASQHETHKVGRSTSKPAYDQVLRVGSEAHTYSRDKDPELKGAQFLTDVAAAFRGNAESSARLARHMHEYEVDNPRYQTRGAGDTTSANFPSLIVPAYITSEYAAKPATARPFADLCRHADLPANGLKVELSKGNTSTTAALQTSELVAVSPGNFDADPLELSVQTAENWALVSRQSLERGAITEQIVMNDLLDGMHSLIDSTLLSQGTTGLFDVATRIDASGTANDWPTLYPLILQAASKVSQVLLNRGKPTHVVVHPRRWYHAESVLGTSWPLINQGMPGNAMGTATANGYNQGLAGRLPSGLDVLMDANVQTQCLAAAQTGGTQDVMYVVSAPNCVLFEASNREVHIRAEAPAANQLGVLLVVYEYFAYTFQQFPSGAAYKINGVATVPPSGF